MKQKLLQEIKKINDYEYLHCLGIGYNVKQLKSYLADLQKFNSIFYESGWEEAGKYLYGTEEQKCGARKIYDRWCRREECKQKIEFISGWNNQILD